MGAVVGFGNQYLESEHTENDHTQGKSSDHHKWNLQQLTQDLLPFGKVMLSPAGIVDDDPLPPKLGPGDLDGPHAPDIPSNAKVDLPDLPVLQEDGAPDGGKNGVGKGVSGQELPCEKPRDGRECKEDDIGLDECEIKGNLHE